MFCKKCGKELADTAKFCRYCGNEIIRKEAVPVSEPINEPVFIPEPEEPVEIEQEPVANEPSPFAPVQTAPAVAAVEEPASPAKAPKKSLFTPLNIGIAAAVLALVIAIPLIVVFAVNKDKTSDDPDAETDSEVEVIIDSGDSDDGDVSVVDNSPVYDLSYAVISPIPDQIYTGYELTVPVVVTLDGNILVAGEDYGYSFENNANIGTARVTIQAMGNNVGSNSTTFNIITGNPVCDDANNYGAVFMVVRLYYYLLDRYPEPQTLINVVYGLVDGSMSGIDLVNSIINSDEFIGRGLSDGDFLNAFYRGVLNREPDAAGYDSNLAILQDGVSRTDLVNSIIGTSGGEFENICNSIGIRSGI